MRTPATWKQELTIDAGSQQGVTSNNACYSWWGTDWKRGKD